MFCESILPLSNYNKGNGLTLSLATIHKDISLNSVWEASDNRGQKHNLLRQSENIATITIGRQGHKFFIGTLAKDSGSCGLCYIFEEGRNIWSSSDLRA
ncbi:MAG: hypothetical protein ACR2KT_14765 [Methylocella sp.]